MALALYDHQNDALDALTTAFDDGAARATVEMATGTGKSFTQAELLCRYLPEGPCAAFVPSEQLLRQNAAEYKIWAAANGHPEPFIVGVFSGDARDALDAATTDPARLQALVDSAKAQGRPVLVVSTYASSKVVEASQTGPFSLLVGDEAHRMASGEEEDEVGDWGKPLYDAHIPAARRAFFTATLRPKGSMDQETNAVSMNNRDLFGNVVYSMGYAAARDAGILAPITPEVVVLEAAAIEAAMEAGGAGRRDDESEGAFKARRRTFAAALMLEGAVDRARADNGRASVLALCPPGENGGYADALAEEAGRILAPKGITNIFSVHGKGDPEAEERAIALGKTPDAELVTTVVDKLREGTDMPALNALLVARPAKSHVLTIQALGRIARLHKKEWIEAGMPPKQARVYIPVIRDSRAADPLADGEAFSSFLSAFLRMDEQALKAYQQAQTEDGRAQAKASGAAPTDAATTTALANLVQISAGSAEAQDLIAAIAMQMSQKDDIGYQHRMMGRYLAHLESGGEAEIKTPKARADDPERFVLGNWQKQMTSAYAAGRLPPDEEALLEGTQGFVFATSTRPDLARGCATRFAQRHGRAPMGQDGSAAAALAQQMHRMALRTTQAKPARMEGGAAWDAEADAWWQAAKAQQAAPLWLGVKAPRDGDMGAVGTFHPAPDGAGWVFQTAARAPWMGAGVQAGVDKPAPHIPVHTLPSMEGSLTALAGHKASYRFSMSLDPSGAFVRFSPVPESLENARAERRVASATAAPQSFQAKSVAQTVQMVHAMGLPCPDSDLLKAIKKPHAQLPVPGVRAAARPSLAQVARVIDGVREDHLQGKLDPGSEHLLDTTPGFRWFQENDWSRTVAHRGQQRPAALVAAERVRERMGDSWGKTDGLPLGDARAEAMLQVARVAYAERVLRRQIANGEPLDEIDRKRHAKWRGIIAMNPDLFAEVFPIQKGDTERCKEVLALSQQAKEHHKARREKAKETLG